MFFCKSSLRLARMSSNARPDASASMTDSGRGAPFASVRSEVILQFLQIDVLLQKFFTLGPYVIKCKTRCFCFYDRLRPWRAVCVRQIGSNFAISSDRCSFAKVLYAWPVCHQMQDPMLLLL